MPNSKYLSKNQQSCNYLSYNEAVCRVLIKFELNGSHSHNLLRPKHPEGGLLLCVCGCAFTHCLIFVFSQLAALTKVKSERLLSGCVAVCPACLRSQNLTQHIARAAPSVTEASGVEGGQRGLAYAPPSHLKP